jgi:hypothetical protein
MRKVLLSLVVVVTALLVPGGSHGVSTVADVSNSSVPAPDLPVLRNDGVPAVPLATVAPPRQITAVPDAGPVVGGPGTATAPAAVPDGGSSSSVVDGTTNTPRPGTCSGMSMTKESSEDGRRDYTRTRMDNCSADTSEDDCDGSSSCDN